MTRAEQIFRNVLDAMQDAEEMEGVEGMEYFNLMQDIIEEARTRLCVCALNIARERINR
jgi:hypothetical protein